jgi:hypothetical protein
MIGGIQRDTARNLMKDNGSCPKSSTSGSFAISRYRLALRAIGSSMEESTIEIQL